MNWNTIICQAANERKFRLTVCVLCNSKTVLCISHLVKLTFFQIDIERTSIVNYFISVQNEGDN